MQVISEQQGKKHTKLALTSIHELRQQGGFILIWARKDYKT